MEKRKAIIIGGGPAGLTAAYELLCRTDIRPVVIEKEALLGGISRTVSYKGNRMDIGGHRFFSKSDRVMKWWNEIMPVETPETPAATNDRVMLLRDRISRIYFLRRFFDYPISLTWNTMRNLGLRRIVRIGCSYARIRLFPIRRERSLEDFYINRFGRELYETFFKDYTEKLWGIRCSEISPDWGSQRVKGLSVSKAVLHALKQLSGRKGDLSQKGTETSLIERFIYPKYGPGQLWEEVGRRIEAGGGEIFRTCRVESLLTDGARVRGVRFTDKEGRVSELEADYVISTMPLRELVAAMDCDVPRAVREVASGLVYRDFMTVGLLLDGMNLPETFRPRIYPDTWIYIQERNVRLGRVQLFNNWSPYLVASEGKVWIGLEYFVDQGDELWSMPDDRFIRFAIGELASIGMIRREDVLDATVLRVEKAYPAYFGTYGRLGEVTDYLDRFDNLFLIGRNGMHRYNNQDHSMLTAMAAVDNIVAGRKDKSNIWKINTEREYHESK